MNQSGIPLPPSMAAACAAAASIPSLQLPFAISGANGGNISESHHHQFVSNSRCRTGTSSSSSSSLNTGNHNDIIISNDSDLSRTPIAGSPVLDCGSNILSVSSMIDRSEADKLISNH